MKRIRSTPAPVVAMLNWMVAVAAAWLAVGSQPWAQTFLVAAVGGLYFLFPPSGVFPRLLLALFCILLLLGGTAFLPAEWLGVAFREPFHDHGIDLPWTLSPQPWWSLEDITLLFATLLWAWNCFEAKLSIEQREFLITAYLFVMGFIAIDTIVRGTSIGQNLPSFLREAGQFANRNQTGDLLVMGGIFSFVRGLSEISKRKIIGAFWMIMTIIFMTAIIRNGSRAAVGLFGIGLLLSYNLGPRARRHGWITWAGLLIVVFIGMLIFAFEGANLRDRFNLLLAGGDESRLSIYQDTVSMVMRNPWCGVGLGNFESVFNTERFHSAKQMTRCLHPESDWLWIASELGVAGVIIFAFMVIMTFRIYLSKTPFSHLTQTSAVIAVLFLIHSFVDVGGHRLGTIWNSLYLVSLGAFRPASPTDGKLPQITLRLAGLLLLVVAVLRIQSTSVNPLMPTHASLAKVEESLLQGLLLGEQKNLLNKSILWAPLDWSLYDQRALVCMRAHEPLSDSTADFNRALYLEQNSIELPLAIGEACRNTNRPEALLAWREALKRGDYRREEILENLYMYTGLDVKTRLEMTTLAEGDTNLEAIAVVYQNPPEFDWLRQNLLAANPALEGVSPTLAKKFFDRWMEVGDVEELIKDWPLHPTWKAPGWRAYVRGLAKVGRYKDAVTMGLQLIQASPMPDFPEPQDADEAKLPKPSTYSQYLLAKSLAAADQNEAAWRTMNPLLNEQ
jgi:hypothetical protein